MEKHKKPIDINQLAASIVGEATEGKNPAAVALGRLGGLKGGKARARKLSTKQRKAIARMGGLAKAARANNDKS